MSAINLQQKPFDFTSTGEAHGMTYLILQHPGMGHLCGYVLIPEGHPLHSTTVSGDYDTPCVDVYGGLTWAGQLPNREGVWLGFDCAHCDDLVPAMAANGMTFPDATFKDPEFVRGELFHLIDQLVTE